MQRLPFVTLITTLLILWPVGRVEAGPYDGEWRGVATVTGGRCKPIAVTLTVGNTSVEGEARFERDTRSIYGTVTADGAFGATIGFDHLTGTFAGNLFEGTFKRADCTYRMMLKRTGQTEHKDRLNRRQSSSTHPPPSTETRAAFDKHRKSDRPVTQPPFVPSASRNDQFLRRDDRIVGRAMGARRLIHCAERSVRPTQASFDIRHS